MRSREYWAERMSSLNEHLLQKAEDILPEIESAYQRAIDRMQRDIEVFYQRYATQEGVSLAQAKQKLSAAERKSFALSVEEYIKAAQEHGADSEWVKTLEAASVRHRITRLEALKLQMQQQVEILSAQKGNALTKTLAEIFEEGYYRTGYEIQCGLGVGTAFATLDVKRIQAALARPWSPDGMNFSQRVWGRDRSKLIHALQSTFTDGLIRGDTQQRMIDDMKKALGISRRVAGRLVMTESAAIASAAKQDAYQRLGTKQFQFRSTLDGTTCDRCGLVDGQVFDLSEYEIGVTAPPLHPFCRCMTVPYFEDEFTVGERRAARDEDGGVYDVPADMTFEEWKRDYVVGNPFTIHEKSAIMKYISAKSFTLNEKLRDGIDLDAAEKAIIENLDRALRKAPLYYGNLVRSVDFPAEEQAQEFLESYRIGESIRYPQYISATKGDVYNSKAKIQIYIQNGSKGRDISAFNEAEQEVLYERNSEFRVLNMKEYGGIYYILLEEV